ncbi:Copia protein [Gossypium australe]|uniref:Copia protein n=1 Tax=Gossypium australe TaxID=47621 RepID=A0A5B6WNF1_9ROSI|nr:Copia protein [Gossypium australe]
MVNPLVNAANLSDQFSNEKINANGSFCPKQIDGCLTRPIADSGDLLRAWIKPNNMVKLLLLFIVDLNSILSQGCISSSCLSQANFWPWSFFPKSSSLALRGFVDAAWGSCSDTRRYNIGFCTYLGDALISWKSKK